MSQNVDILCPRSVNASNLSLGSTSFTIYNKDKNKKLKIVSKKLFSMIPFHMVNSNENKTFKKTNVW